MAKRTLTGTFIVLAVYLAVYFSYIPFLLPILTLLISLMAVVEIFRATKMIKKPLPFSVSLIFAVVISLLPLPFYKEASFIVFAIAVISFALLMLGINKWSFDRAICPVLISMLIVLMFKAIPELRNIENGLYYLTLAVTLCFVTDVAAYLIGKPFGRHKLAPKVSPNKSVEGAVAGVVFAILFAVGLGALAQHFLTLEINYITLLLYAFAASIVGQFGDLSMSAVKRAAGIKDFSNILPGHGGILDRFDSHLFAVPFTYLFCVLTGGFIGAEG